MIPYNQQEDMRYNDFGIDFKYLIVNEKDKSFGLTVNTVGFQPIPPHALYPSTEHPKNYYFDPCTGMPYFFTGKVFKWAPFHLVFN